MKQRLTAILCLLLFTAFHTGRQVNYLYCKWKQEVVLKTQDCGCDEHLVAAAADDHHDQQGPKQAPQDKPLEYEMSQAVSFTAVPVTNTRCFPTYFTSLAEGWELCDLRPPRPLFV